MIYIRADANPYIGMGHIMRCLSIADAFHTVGNSPIFILADEHVLPLIIERGYEAVVIHSDYNNMEAELPLWESQGIVSADLIIVDSYYVTSDYLKSLKTRVGENGKLVYLDDLASFPYPVDILINYNAFAKDSIYKSLYRSATVDMPQLILGCSFAPLRGMFRGVARKKQPEKVKNILISTGGADKLRLSISLIRAFLENESEKERAYHFLLGTMNADKEEIHALAEGHNNLILHENVSDMRGLLEKMDLVVSAAGSTLYEICACGIPLITYTLADNQLPGAQAFHCLGLAMNIGDLRETLTVDSSVVASGKLASSAVQRIMAAVEEKSYDYAWRMEVGHKMQEMIDGFGADRMVKKILKS